MAKVWGTCFRCHRFRPVDRFQVKKCLHGTVFLCRGRTSCGKHAKAWRQAQRTLRSSAEKNR